MVCTPEGSLIVEIFPQTIYKENDCGYNLHGILQFTKYVIPFNSLNTVLSGLPQMFAFADEELKVRVAQGKWKS